MKDIKLDKWWKEAFYFAGWLSVINIIWAVIILTLYLKDYDKAKKKGILNKTYQKLVFIMGALGISVLGLTFVISLVLHILQRLP